MTTYYLLAKRNPKAKGGFHGHQADVKKTCIVVHTSENDPTSSSAQGVARYFATTERQVSYHSVVDSSGVTRCLPYGYVAFHAVNFNRIGVGLSFATRASLWGRHPAWEEAAIRHGAAELKRMAEAFDIPIRRITAAQARAGKKGVLSHGQADPSRRSDPGSKFPWDRFFELARGKRAWRLGDRILTLEDPLLSGGDVLELQHLLVRWRSLQPDYQARLRGEGSALPEGVPLTEDGVYGTATANEAKRAIRNAGLQVGDGLVRVGPRSLEALRARIEDLAARVAPPPPPLEEQQRPATPDLKLAVVASTDVDEGAARVLAAHLGCELLRYPHLPTVRRAVLVGAAGALKNEYAEHEIVAGANRRETAAAVLARVRGPG